MAETQNNKVIGAQKPKVSREVTKGKKSDKKGTKSTEQSLFTNAVPATVQEVVGRTGTRGEAIQVRCKVLEGRDQNKVLRRNVRGPIQVGDTLMLRETEVRKWLSSLIFQRRSKMNLRACYR